MCARFLNGLFLSFLTASIAATGTARALTIDEFNGNGGAAETQPGGIDFGLTTDNSAIGGTRAFRIELITGIQGSGAEVLTSGGTLTHSQVFGAVARSLITWDGDGIPQNLSAAGLGGVDFGQDGGDAIVLDFLGNDFEVTLRVTIYDASDPLGGKFSRATLVRPAGGAGPVTIPFSQFTTSGPGGAASWNSVGAVTLEIDGQLPNLDLGLQNLRTNGSCSLVPNSAGRVLDDCGVCGGNNEAKDSCGVCFGLNEDLDDCGVCFGNNASKDACGICGGDGSTCISCTESDLTSVKSGLTVSSREQRTCSRQAIRKVSGKNRSLVQRVRTIGKLFVEDIVEIVSTVRTTNVQCGNSIGCTSVSVHEEVVNLYRSRVRTFSREVTKILKDLRVTGGECRGTAQECRERIRERARARRIARKTIRECAQQALEPLSQLPTTESICS